LYCPNKQSDSDPIHSWLLQECASVLVLTVTNSSDSVLVRSTPLLKVNYSLSSLTEISILDEEQRSNHGSRSFKATDFGSNRKPIYDFLLEINSNLPSILHRFQVTADYMSRNKEQSFNHHSVYKISFISEI